MLYYFELLTKRVGGLLFLFFSLHVNAQELKPYTISGLVVSEGQPIVGAAVSIKNTSVGTFTNPSGGFSLNLPAEIANPILQVQALGYEAQEFSLDEGQLEITIDLRVQELPEVVVTALGIRQDAKTLGYAVQEVKGNVLTQAREANFVQSLVGRVAGANVIQGASGIGSSSRIVLRGETSLSLQNEPLFVVDGIPIQNQRFHSETDFGNLTANLNPDDIESITVLKGPSAAALYGARAANGAILITSKSGQRAGKLQVTFNSNFTAETILQMPEWQNEYGQGSNFMYAYENGRGGGIADDLDESWGPRLDGQLIPQFDSPTTNGFRGGDTQVANRGAIIPTPWIPQPNNVKDFYETGQTFTNHLAIAGGNSDSDFRLGVTHLQNKGILPNTDFRRTNLHLNIGKTFAEKLTARINLNYIRSGSENRPAHNYIADNVNRTWVWFGRQVNLESLRNYWQAGKEGFNHFNYVYTFQNNPYFVLYENTNAFERDRLVGNIVLNYQITPHLNMMLRSGTDFFTESQRERKAFSSRNHPFGRYTEVDWEIREVNTDFLLTYQKHISADFRLQASVGGNYMKRDEHYQLNDTEQLQVPNVYNLANTRIPVRVNSTTNEKAIASLYGFAQLSYRDKLFLDITGRNDWSSTLPIDNNAYFYPSITFSGHLHELLPLPSVISFAKFRASYAAVGKDTAPYLTQNGFILLPAIEGNPVVIEPGFLANSQLQPERSTNREVGVDLRFFQDRLGIDVTYYHQLSTNQILSLPLPQSTGYSSRAFNAGEIRNEGIEIMLNAQPLKLSNGLEWLVQLNWARNRNKVLKLAEGIETLTLYEDDVAFAVREGGSIGDFYGLERVRNESGEVLIGDIGLPSLNPDPVKLGNYNPDWMAGLYNTVRFKGIELGVLFDMKAGGEMFSQLYLRGSRGGTLAHTAADREEGIVSEGVIDNGDGTYRPNDLRFPTQQFYELVYSGIVQDVATFDASYIKLREVRLSYSLPQSLLEKLSIQRAQISLVGRNLALWTDMPYVDPDTYTIAGNLSLPGFENMSQPSTRSWGVNLNLVF